MSGILRWTFDDPVAGDAYTVLVNPLETDSMFPPMQIGDVPTTFDGRVRMFGKPAMPASWTFSGVVREQSHYEALAEWTSRANRMKLTDHLGREWLIQFIQFDPRSDGTRRAVPWRHRYTVTALLFGPYPSS